MVLLTEDGGATWTIDVNYPEAFDGLSGFDAFARYAVLTSVSYPAKGRGMVAGEHQVIVGMMGQGFCSDFDGDGHEDEACGGDDCDDNNAYVSPSAEEQCNHLDENCDGVPDDGFDLMRDPKNCGDCGFNCQPAMVCWDGECTLDCPGELTRCGQECVDPQSHPRHCGVCDNACEYDHAEGACVDGACVMGDCQDGFIDLNADEADGCEYACTPSGDEICDDVDNDCDGEIDEPPADCGTGDPDGGTNPDGGSSGTDTGGTGEEGGDGGCSCTTHANPAGLPALLTLAGLAARRRRIRR
jgi:MYXO-CTERM domain-containing protein